MQLYLFTSTPVHNTWNTFQNVKVQVLHQQPTLQQIYVCQGTFLALIRFN